MLDVYSDKSDVETQRMDIENSNLDAAAAPAAADAAATCYHVMDMTSTRARSL